MISQDAATFTSQYIDKFTSFDRKKIGIVMCKSKFYLFLHKF